jgi:hypothetical protein
MIEDDTIIMDVDQQGICGQIELQAMDDRLALALWMAIVTVV